MIKLTLYNDSDVIVNADLIECVERTPDTLITLTNGKKLMVQETVEDVIGKVISYKRVVTKNTRLFAAKGKFSLRSAMRGSDSWT